MNRFLDWFFGCSHSRTSFPLTRKIRFKPNLSYVVCLNCGKEFEYDWQKMKIGKAIPQDSTSHVSKEQYRTGEGEAGRTSI